MFQNFESEMVGAVRNISMAHSQYPCYFIQLAYSKFADRGSVFLNYFSPTNRSVFFKRNFTQSNLREFVDMLVFPPISYDSQQFFLRANEVEATVVLLADEPPFFESRLLSLTKQFPETLRSGVLSCAADRKVCRRLVVPMGCGPQLLMNNPSKRYIWYYRGDLNDTAKVIGWVLSVLNGQIRAAGPGAGFAGFIANMFDAAGSRGIAAIGLLVAVGAAFAIVCMLGVSQSIPAEGLFAYEKLE
jgi:hypothetical protein